MDPIGAPRSRTLALALLTVLVVGACGGEAQPTAGPTALATPAASGLATGAPTAVGSAPPSVAPSASPAATALLNPGFQFGDILKVMVNRLAGRSAPNRSAALVHEYDLSGPAPMDNGVVRLNKGDFVSVELGPIAVGTTTWYLVWPATATALHPDGPGWYTDSPPDGEPGPAWVAGSVGTDVYLGLQKRPSESEVQAFGDFGISVAATGNFVSAPQQRHDAFAFEWAASTPTAGTACAFKLDLVPADASVDRAVITSTTTTSVKVSGRTSRQIGPAWLPIPAGSWTTFTINVTSTCHWAIHVWRLEHD